MNSRTLYSSISFLHLFAVSLSYLSLSLKTSSKCLFLLISYNFNEKLLFSCLKPVKLLLLTRRVFCISNLLLLVGDSSKVSFRIGSSFSGETTGLLWCFWIWSSKTLNSSTFTFLPLTFTISGNFLADLENCLNIWMGSVLCLFKDGTSSF